MKTVEKDPAGGWIARNAYTGKEILEEGFRWNCRESARTAVWEAQHLSPEAKAANAAHGVLGPGDQTFSQQPPTHPKAPT